MIKFDKINLNRVNHKSKGFSSSVNTWLPVGDGGTCLNAGLWQELLKVEGEELKGDNLPGSDSTSLNEQ